MKKGLSIKELVQKTLNKENRFSLIMCFVLSFLYAVLYIAMGQFCDHNSLSELTASKALLALSMIKALIFTAVLGSVLSLLSVIMKEKLLPGAKKVNKPEILFLASFVVMLMAYLPWLLLTFPGSANADCNLQLQMFLGETELTNWQPVVSTYLMGGCYTLGQYLPIIPKMPKYRLSEH